MGVLRSTQRSPLKSPSVSPVDDNVINMFPPGMETFSAFWTIGTGATPTFTTGQLDPFGGLNGCRAQTTGGSTTWPYTMSSDGTKYAVIGYTGQRYRARVWINNIGSTVLKIGHPNIFPVQGVQTVNPGFVGWLNYDILPNGIHPVVKMSISTVTAGDATDFIMAFPMMYLDNGIVIPDSLVIPTDKMVSV